MEGRVEGLEGLDDRLALNVVEDDLAIEPTTDQETIVDG